MQRRSIPAILEEIGALLDIEGDNPYRAQAYHNAAKILSGLDNLDAIITEGRLKEVKGIGETLSLKITEYLETGEIASHEDLKRKIPVSLIELLRIPNLGPGKIKVLHDSLGVTNVGELEYACRENRLVNLRGFGEKTQGRILKGIEFFKEHRGEFLLGETYPLAMRLKERLSQTVDPALIEVCGSVRRRNEIVRDIDLLAAASEWADVSAAFVSMPEVEEVIAEGETKTSCRLTHGINADLRVVPEVSYAPALIYFTGSKEHNVRLRGLAKDKGLKLNEYGLFAGERQIPLATEGDVYASLGLSFIPPELREDSGEIEAAANGTLPRLVEMADLKGTFHVHTSASDGSDELEAIAKAARRMGLSYVGIADHSRSAAYAGGLKADDVRRQWEAIDRFNARNSDFCFFKGIESDILTDGTLDYDDETLAGFDFVVASIHSGFFMSGPAMEERIIRAMRSPFTTILGHPTGRLLLARDGYRVDMGAIIEAAAEYKVVIELNASPYRLDIDWRHLARARVAGVLISIDPDAHEAEGLADLFYGVGAARKGWMEPARVLNTRSADEVAQFLKELRDEKGY
jgi:DNA polymerase (family 10)